MKPKILYILFLIMLSIIIFLLIRINKIENVVEGLEKNIERLNQYNSNNVKISTTDKIQNQLDRLEENFNGSRKYIDIVTERYSEKEFEYLLDSFLSYKPQNLYIHLESLKIYVNLLEETLKYNDNILIKYASELLEVSDENENRVLTIRNYVTNEIENVEISSNSEFYLGSQFYRHKTTLDNLITPGEPLEAGIFTLVYIDGVVKYIFTGRTY